MTRARALALVLSLALGAGMARADGEGDKTQPKPAEKQLAKKPKHKNEVPEDIDNVKGISPYESQIAEGKRFAQAENWPAAAAAFQKAIEMLPEEPRGYLLLAQAKREGDVLQVVDKGRSKKGSEAVESKLLMVRAALLERAASLTPVADSSNLGEMLKTVWDKSIEAWKAYAAYVTQHTRAPDYKANAEDRVKKIAERQQRERVYAVVRSKRDNR